MVFGPAYKGIPLSVVTVMGLAELYGKQARYCSNRKEEKDHGDAGILLGSALADGDRVVMVEDVTTSGKSIDGDAPRPHGAGAGGSGGPHGVAQPPGSGQRRPEVRARRSGRALRLPHGVHRGHGRGDRAPARPPLPRPRGHRRRHEGPPSTPTTPSTARGKREGGDTGHPRGAGEARRKRSAPESTSSTQASAGPAACMHTRAPRRCACRGGQPASGMRVRRPRRRPPPSGVRRRGTTSSTNQRGSSKNRYLSRPLMDTR